MKAATEKAIELIKKQYGKDAVMLLGDKVGVPIEVIPTGVLSVDIITGVGGIPRGRITEIFGPESSGKTTLALLAIAATQKQGFDAVIVDAENAFDPTYAAALGVDVDKLLVSQPDSGEQALGIIELFLMSGTVPLIAVDSVDAMIPQDQLDADFGKSLPGLQARMMSQGLRKLKGLTRRSNSAVVFINQIRMDIMQMHGPKETTSGGRALKFYASMRIEVRRSTAIKDRDQKTEGFETKIKIVKNKVAAPFQETIVEMEFGTGINKAADLLRLGVETDVISKSGHTYKWGDHKIGVGKPNAIDWLAMDDNSEDAFMIAEEIKKKKGLGEHVSEVLMPEAEEDDLLEDDLLPDELREGENQ